MFSAGSNRSSRVVLLIFLTVTLDVHFILLPAPSPPSLFIYNSLIWFQSFSTTTTTTTCPLAISIKQICFVLLPLLSSQRQTSLQHSFYLNNWAAAAAILLLHLSSSFNYALVGFLHTHTQHSSLLAISNCVHCTAFLRTTLKKLVLLLLLGTWWSPAEVGGRNWQDNSRWQEEWKEEERKNWKVTEQVVVVVVAAIAVHRTQQQCSVCSAVIRFQVHSPSFPFLSSVHLFTVIDTTLPLGFVCRCHPDREKRRWWWGAHRCWHQWRRAREEQVVKRRGGGGSPTKFRLIWPSSMDHTHTTKLTLLLSVFLVFSTCLGSEWESLSFGDDGDGTRWQDHRSTI